MLLVYIIVGVLGVALLCFLFAPKDEAQTDDQKDDQKGDHQDS